MEMQEYDYPSFRERMDDAQTAARTVLERRAYLGAKVTYRRPPAIRFQTVPEAALRLGVSARRVRALCDQGRIPGVIQRRSRGREWAIPLDAVPTSGSRGPKPRFFVEPPF